MDNSLSREATDWREGRRFRIFKLKQQGWSQQRIAEALGVSKGAVSQWMKRSRDGGGVVALKRRPAPGARPRLSKQQRAKVPELLERGAEAHGFRGEVWTCERVVVGELKKPQNHPFSQAVETLDSAARRTFGGSAFNSSSI